MKKALIQRFFETFDGDVQKNIASFSQEISKIDSEVCIFMARKAACFFECLRELGIADTKGKAYHDRILDMDLGFLKNKKVTLIDDCVFTGTSLYKAKRKVENAGCISVDTFALAVNSEAIHPELLPGKSEASSLNLRDPLFKLTNSDCVGQCHDIVRAISIIPKPYDVDFPHSFSIKIKSNTFFELINAPGWQSIEVGSDYQKRNNVSVFTILPHKIIEKRFWNLHGVFNSENYHAKVRVYARKSADVDSYIVRFVPMVMLPLIKHSNISDFLSYYFKGKINIEKFGFLSPSSKFRLLSLLVSQSLFLYFKKSMLDMSSNITHLKLRNDLIEMSFGTQFSEIFENLSGLDTSDFIIPESGNFPELTNRKRKFPRYSEHDVIDEYADLASHVATPFSRFYRELELPAQKLVKEIGLKKAFTSGNDVLNRLDEGVSYADFCSTVESNLINIPWGISAIIDQFVDCGIAVPINFEIDSSYFRAFRHGEDAVLDEAGERLLYLAMKSYIEAAKIPYLSKLEFEKIIVLFTQIFIRMNELTDVKLSAERNSSLKILSVKGYLHGNVPIVEVVDNPEEDLIQPFLGGNARKNTWLHTEWLNKGYLTSEPMDLHPKVKYTQYKLGKNVPKFSIGEKKDSRAQLVGACIGKAVAVSAISRKKANDFVMLTTCTDPEHMIRALSGELNIFYNRWPQMVRIIEKLSDERIKNNTLRNWGDIFTSLNSGTMKYKWVSCENNTLSNEIEVFIKSAKEKLDSIEPFIGNYWTQLWPNSFSISISDNIPLWKFITSCGLSLLALKLIVNSLSAEALSAIDAPSKNEISMLNKTHETIKEDVDLFYNRLASYKSSIKPTDKKDQKKNDSNYCDSVLSMLMSFGRKIEEFAKEENFSIRNIREIANLGHEFSHKMSSTIGKCFLDEISIFVNNYAKISKLEFINFPYAIHFASYDNDDTLFSEIIKALKNGNIKRYLVLNNSENPFSEGILIALSGNKNSKDAVKLTANVINSMLSKGLPIHCIHIGQLSKENCIRKLPESAIKAKNYFFDCIFNLKDKISQSTGDFSLSMLTEFKRDSEYAENYESEVEKFQRILRHVTVKFKEEVVTLGNPLYNAISPSSENKNEKYPTIDEEIDMFDEEIFNDTLPHMTFSVAKIDPYIKKKSTSKKAKILLCTATNTEDEALTSISNDLNVNIIPINHSDILYHEVKINPTYGIFWIRSNAGSTGSGGAILTIADAIKIIRPDYVFSCGIAFGADPEKQKIGDIIVSNAVRSYEPGRQTNGVFTPRGDKIPASPRILQALYSYNAHNRLKPKFGLLLSGEKLVDDTLFKKQLLHIEPEAIGGDMESYGIADVCFRNKIQWIIIKSISDWGEGKENSSQFNVAIGNMTYIFNFLKATLL